MAEVKSSPKVSDRKQKLGVKIATDPSISDTVLYAALDLGTNSCRMLIAKPDGSKFAIVLDRVFRETGLKLKVISPAEEARLAIISCAPLLEAKSNQVLVVDIGGGSTELVWIDLSSVPAKKRIEAMINFIYNDDIYEEYNISCISSSSMSFKLN